MASQEHHIDIQDEQLKDIVACLCDIVKNETETLSCAAAKGNITMSEYESFRENMDIFSTVTVDPATGAVSHGITTSPTLFVALTLTNVLCNGDATGTATEVVTGGTAPFVITYTEVPGGGPATQGALIAGTYKLTVNDANNITRVVTFVITEPAALGLTVNVQNETAAGLNNGIASAVVTGGTTPYTFVWNDNLGTPIGQTTQTATGLAPGTFQVIVTDANACTIQDLNVVIAPGP